MQERVGQHLPDLAAQEQERQELIRLDDVEGFIGGKAHQFSENEDLISCTFIVFQPFARTVTVHPHKAASRPSPTKKD